MEQFSTLFSMITSSGVIALQIATVGILLALVINHTKTLRMITTHRILLLGIVAGGALLGSLIYSYVIGFTACYLCWIQRILMIPIVGIIAIGSIRRHTPKSIVRFTLPFTIAGTIVALYHTLIQNGVGTGSVLCQALGGSSCTQLYVNEFGYITIPVMSLTVFVLLLIISLVPKK